jgi:hypothetical protein
MFIGKKHMKKQENESRSALLKLYLANNYTITKEFVENAQRICFCFFQNSSRKGSSL